MDVVTKIEKSGHWRRFFLNRHFDPHSSRSGGSSFSGRIDVVFDYHGLTRRKYDGADT